MHSPFREERGGFFGSESCVVMAHSEFGTT
jgi:hypothetical protein